MGGADVNAPDARGGTPLHDCALFDSLESANVHNQTQHTGKTLNPNPKPETLITTLNPNHNPNHNPKLEP